ncbi:LptA/OstA family protein [Halarcobacter bivalviorum]|uniref:Lipooligosaccharide transport system, periplasmic component LptA n=1 Tax=Halarcobacter bivalviorum TaxID=663364 RepID=A0AAX2AAV5_9BACT|nr:LptA/OstA family protein [Halarcobacter bivalviorum]AXH12501.1 lipooligosaccharide transport system, periplasmic component LptA [Halarcobacter bivalviorum]RXK07948.1 organic solvent tolerance protein OstA [Halarcobacter bivalviorum]RXK10576.1 organic solvent tolerance protein OstA [Halarcobacter bivalviorum]
MKLLLKLALLSTLAFANASSEKLIIDAKNFETDDNKGISIFTGNVKLKMAKDRLNSDKLEVFMTPNAKGKNLEPLKYIATGNVSFTIFSNGKHYNGKGNKVIYDPKKLEYTVIGKGYLNEVTEDRKLYGEKIFINQETGNAKVSGTDNKPVRFILNIDSGKK